MRAAVDVDRLAGDEAAVIADQEQADRGNLVDLALAPQWDAARVRQMAPRRSGVPFGIVAPGIDAARRYDIDPDVVRREFRGEPARHPDQAHLRRRQVGAAMTLGRNRTVAAKE